MPEPTAWWVNNDNDSYTLWYVNPYENGLEPDVVAIPLYGDWEERFNEIVANLKSNERISCNENGEFSVYEVYVPEVFPEPELSPSTDDAVWTQIAEAVREGINSH